MLFLHPDPAAVSAWCHEHTRSGTLLVAPSAAARRQALRVLAERDGVVVGVSIVSRGRLLPTLEARAGLVAHRPLTSEMERLLAREAGASARVPLFEEETSGGRAPGGAVRALVKLVHDLRMNGVTPEQYADARGDVRAAAAYRHFEHRRRELGLMDEADRYGQLLSCGVPELDLVIDEPHAPHRAAADLLKALIERSFSCHIGMSELTSEVSTLAVDLESWGLSRANRPVLARERGEPRVVAIGGAGQHDEVELVAREMLALLRSGDDVPDESAPGQRRSLRPSDILGIAPTSSYLESLHDACVRIGLPVASPRRRPALEVPLVMALLETFRLLADAEVDTAERGLALLATPYVGLSLPDHDRLARALVLRGLGPLRSWRTVADTVKNARFRRFAETALQLARRLDGERTPREFASALAALGLDHSFLSNGRRVHMAGERDDSVRLDQQGWDLLTNAIERLGDALRLMGVASLSASRWLHELEELLAGETVRMEAKAREGVHLTIAGAGLQETAYVFAVGWKEGLVPRRTREDPLLPDRVKQRLNERGARLLLTADRAGEELERRERVHRSARLSLTLSWPAVDEEGDAQLPSFYFDDLGVRERLTRPVGDPTWPVRIAASRAERLTRATLLAKHRPSATLGDELELVRGALARLTDAERHRWSGALHAGQQVELPPHVLSQAAPLARAMSASQARMFTHCRYEHFGKRRLGLESLVPPIMDPRSLGSIAHDVLAKAGRRRWEAAAVDELLDEKWEALNETIRDDAGGHFEREILRTQLHELVVAERQRVADGLAPSRWFELAFGIGDEGRDEHSLDYGLSLALPPGSAITESVLRGSIDRVDVFEEGDTRMAVAIDYKLGKGEAYGKELEDGVDFQLPIYCAVLPLFGVEAVGAYYLGISSGERYGVIREDVADRFLSPDDKKVRRLAPDAFNAFMEFRTEALRREIMALAAGSVEVRPRNDDCKYCDLRPVCRIGTFGVGGGNGED